MDDSVEYEWILLLHHLPPKPDYFRVRIRRKLRQLGAVGLKNTAYVLPASERSRQEFGDLAAAIRSDGGEAVVAMTRLLSGVTSSDLAAQFRGVSNAAYADVADSARKIADSSGQDRSNALLRLEDRLAGLKARDHFSADGHVSARAALQELRNQVAAEASAA
ncbi:MAG: Chromate resistance protein ChrB, partial [Gemmatimonadales bacterium]